MCFVHGVLARCSDRISQNGRLGEIRAGLRPTSSPVSLRFADKPSGTDGRGKVLDPTVSNQSKIWNLRRKMKSAI